MTATLQLGKTVLEMAADVARVQAEQRQRDAADQERQRLEKVKARLDVLLASFNDMAGAVAEQLRAEGWVVEADAMYDDGSGDHIRISPFTRTWAIVVYPPRHGYPDWRMTILGRGQPATSTKVPVMTLLMLIGEATKEQRGREEYEAEVAEREKQRIIDEADEKKVREDEQKQLQALVAAAQAQAIAAAAFNWPDGFALKVYTVEHQANSHMEEDGEVLYDNRKVRCLDFPKVTSELATIERLGKGPLTIPTAHLICITEEAFTRTEDLPQDWTRQVSFDVPGVEHDYGNGLLKRVEGSDGDNFGAVDEEGEHIRVPTDAIRAEILKRANAAQPRDTVASAFAEGLRGEPFDGAGGDGSTLS